MPLLSVLKRVGKDLGDVEKWVAEGVAVAGPIISLVDPPLGPIIAVVEKILGGLPDITKVDAKTLQSLVTSAAATQGSTCLASPCSCCPAPKAGWPS